MFRLLAVPLVLVFAGAAFAQAPPEPLVKQVKSKIARGVEYLVSRQAKDGGWDTTVDDGKTDFRGGSTALAVLALLNCDGVIDDPKLEADRKQAIAAGLANLRRLKEPTTTYVRALQTMAFAEARTDRALIEANVDWLIKGRAFSEGEFLGWDYYFRPDAKATDGSNTQYAMLALWYARQAGVQVPREVWQKIHDHYRRTQAADGFWIYSPYYDRDDLKRASLTMTVAGLCGLQIAGLELNAGREQALPGGAFKNCGNYSDDAGVAKALQWISRNFTLDLPDRAYYHLYGLERAGRLTGQRFFGEHDWYREGCEYLVKRQQPDGSWKSGGGYDRWPHVNTSFALLFLSKGRTPVLISKLVHGNWPRIERDTDWNNDRNDLRHLTEYIAKGDLFRTSPGPSGEGPGVRAPAGTSPPPSGEGPGVRGLAWQTYDIRRAIEAHLDKSRTLSAADEAAIAADMLQSPVLYLTGHGSLAGRFQDVEVKLIKRYIENGGFIVAEACCGSKEFDSGIKEWVKQLWPDSDLEYLSSEHPVWTCWNKINAGDPYRLMGLQVGCRTVMIYSPADLSCYWESKRDDGRTQLAFRLGENLIAYATGRTPPMPRLTEMPIAGADPEIKRPTKRGYFRAGQVYISSNPGKWQPAPRAMHILLEHVHETHGLDVDLRTERATFPEHLRNSKFLYMHGKDEIRLNKEKIEALRFNLEHGGLLLADACCGNDSFDREFRKLARELFPKEKLTTLSTDPLNRDRLFGAELNGTVLSKSTIKCRTKASGPMEPMEPYLEGIEVGGRWVVLYSKYDLGCALERSTAGDCRGYDHDSALKIATAAVLYNARP